MTDILSNLAAEVKHRAGGRRAALSHENTKSRNPRASLTAADLAATHRDPFDRLLLGVAQSEHLMLLTADAALIALAGKDPRLPLKGV